MIKTFIFCIAIFSSLVLTAQTSRAPVKVSHAEPVYADLVRDLGARKNERELNLGWQIGESGNVIRQSGFVEYEFAPVNRLGIEAEIPFSYHYSNKEAGSRQTLPHEKIEGLKLAMQYTFFVSEKYRTSMAAGGMYEIGLHSFGTMAETRHITNGNTFAPFLIIAKRLGRQFHSLLYTGPVIEDDGLTHMLYQANMSFHYMLPQSGHFIGIEMNGEASDTATVILLRPQVKMKITPNIAVGFASGIPVQGEEEGPSFMTRLIYEFRSR